MYSDKEIKEDCRLVFDVEDVIKHKQMTENNSETQKYINRFEKELAKYGQFSDYIQTQYYINFNIIGDNFTSLERLKGNKILTGDLDTEFECSKTGYKIGAVDPALGRDMAGMFCGIAEFVGDKIISEVKDIIILHDKDSDKISPDSLIKKITNICIAHKLDYVILDTTANQGDRVFYLYQNFKKEGCKTFIVPFDYSSSNKKLMFGYLEDALFNQSIILPKYEYRDKNYPYKEFLTQLLYLKKKKTPSGNIQYKAPDGRNFYDDLPMSFAQFVYAMEYIRRGISERKIVDLGSGIKYFFRKNKYNELKESTIKKVSTWLNIR